MKKFRDLTKLENMLRVAGLLRDDVEVSHEWMSAEQMERARDVLTSHGVPTSDVPGEMHTYPLVTGDWWLSVVCGATTRSTAETVEIAFLRMRLLGGWMFYLHKGRPGWDKTGEVRGYCTFADVLDETAVFVARRKVEVEL